MFIALCLFLFFVWDCINSSLFLSVFPPPVSAKVSNSMHLLSPSALCCYRSFYFVFILLFNRQSFSCKHLFPSTVCHCLCGYWL